MLDERAALLKDARTKAADEVTEAKERVAAEFAAAQREVESGTAQLAAEIAARVLRIPQAPPERSDEITEVHGFCRSLCVACCCSLRLRAPRKKAAEAASAGSAEIFKWINFAIVAGLIVWFFKSTAVPFFKRNAESIASGITKATAAKAEAERKLQDAEQRLANLQKEVRGFREEAEREAAAEAERIALAKFDAEKIGVAAKAEIEAAERAARMELKALAASLAVDGAESLLAKQLTPQRRNR